MKVKKYLLLGLVVLSSALHAQWSVIDSMVGGTFEAIHFVNADTGFSYHNRTLRKTQNGGQTWDSVGIPFSGELMDFTFTSPDTGYIVGGAWFPHATHFSNAILRTTDGGQTWDSILGDYKSGLFNNLAAVGPLEYYVAGNNWFLHSDNGGLSHDTLRPSSLSNEQYLKVRFNHPDTGYVLASHSLGLNQVVKQLYKTTNGAQNWQSVYNDTSSWGAMDFVLSPKGEIYLCGDFGYLLYSKDGGANWQSFPFNNPVQSLYELELVDGKLFAIGTDGLGQESFIFKSEDKGVTWQTEFVSQPSFSTFRDISFPTAAVGYTILEDRIYKGATSVTLPESRHSVFTMYPNPAAHQVFIKLQNKDDAAITLYNTALQKVGSYTVMGQPLLEINVHHLTRGLYFLKVEQSGHQFYQQLLKE